MTDYTVITETLLIRLEAHHWAPTESGDVNCYPDDDGGEPVAHIPAEQYVGIVETERLLGLETDTETLSPA